MRHINHAGLFIVGLISIELLGSLFHIWVVPPRYTLWDFGIVIPVLLCVVIGVVLARRISSIWVVLFAVLQGMLLIEVYSNCWRMALNWGDFDAVIRLWAVLISSYTIIFTGVTVGIAKMIERRKQPRTCFKTALLVNLRHG